MKSVSISGLSRTNVGKKDAKAVRNAGFVPCVLYGGKVQKSFSIKYNDLLPLVYTPEVLTVDLTIDGTTYKALMQEIQFNPINDKIVHIDFLEMFDSKPVFIDIPVHTTGNSIGVKAGGKLVIKMKSLKVKALPKDLREFIELDITNLELNGNLRVQDVNAPNMEILNPARIPVASVVMTRQLKQEENAAAAPAKK